MLLTIKQLEKEWAEVTTLANSMSFANPRRFISQVKKLHKLSFYQHYDLHGFDDGFPGWSKPVNRSLYSFRYYFSIYGRGFSCDGFLYNKIKRAIKRGKTPEYIRTKWGDEVEEALQKIRINMEKVFKRNLGALLKKRS